MSERQAKRLRSARRFFRGTLESTNEATDAILLGWPQLSHRERGRVSAKLRAGDLLGAAAATGARA